MLGVLGISKCKILALFAFILIWRTSSTSSCQYIPLHTVGHLFFQTFLLDYVFKMDETICASYAHDNNHISNNAEMIQKNCPIDHESWKHTAINASFFFFSFFFFCISKSRTTKICWNKGADHLLLAFIKLF